MNAIARSPADHDTIRSIVAGVDEVAVAMETKWGVGRLPRLVNDDFRRRFFSQARKFNDALWTGSPADIEIEGGRMRTAWTALDAAATQAGCTVLSPDIWELRLKDGRVVALVRTIEEQHAAVRAGRHVEVYSAYEIGNLIDGYPEVAKAKQVFPGATVEAVRKQSEIDWHLGDATPEFTP